MSALPAPDDLLASALEACDLTDAYPEGLSDDQRRRALHELRLIARADLRGLAEPLASDAEFSKLSKAVDGWKKKAKTYLKNLFVAGALILFGPTTEGLDRGDRAEIDRQLDLQGDYLDDFAKEADEENPENRGAAFLARAESYGSSVWQAAWAVSLSRATRSGNLEGRRVHRGADTPCPDCIRANAVGWVAPEDLTPIGDSRCGARCHCVFIFRTKDISMSKLSKAERDKLPEGDFGDPARRLFPIVDQDDVESAAHLIGKAKDPEKVRARIIAIARRKKLTLPEAWDKKEKASMSAGAAFDLGTPKADDSDSGMVLYENSKLFEVGDFPDKDFAMTPEELWAATESFAAPVPIDLEHTPTVLDGKLGEVRDLRLEGEELRGTVAIPKWLDGLLEDGKRKVSCHWDRATKTLQKLSLVQHPRIADAALMAAFAEAKPDEAAAVFAGAHRTYHGASTIQSLHDTAARAGALCDPTNKAQFTTGRERSAMQQIHDLAVKSGAKCSVMSDRSAAMYSAETPNSQPQGKTRMSLRDRFAALFGGKAKPTAAEAKAKFSELPDAEMETFLAELSAAPGEVKTEPATAAASFSESPEGKAMKEEIETLKRQNAAAAIERDAVTFADAEINAERSFPSDKADLVADYIQAASDDLETNRKVTFAGSDGKAVTGSRVDRLKVRSAKRPRHALFREFLTGQDLPTEAVVLFAGEAPKSDKPDQARIDELLAQTETGRMALERRKK